MRRDDELKLQQAVRNAAIGFGLQGTEAESAAYNSLRAAIAREESNEVLKILGATRKGYKGRKGRKRK